MDFDGEIIRRRSTDAGGGYDGRTRGQGSAHGDMDHHGRIHTLQGTVSDHVARALENFFCRLKKQAYSAVEF